MDNLQPEKMSQYKAQRNTRAKKTRFPLHQIVSLPAQPSNRSPSHLEYEPVLLTTSGLPLTWSHTTTAASRVTTASQGCSTCSSCYLNVLSRHFQVSDQTLPFRDLFSSLHLTHIYFFIVFMPPLQCQLLEDKDFALLCLPQPKCLEQGLSDK